VYKVSDIASGYKRDTGVFSLKDSNGGSMGVGRIFSRGALDFSKIFPGVKNGEICFFPLEIKKTNIFSKVFKI